MTTTILIWNTGELPDFSKNDTLEELVLANNKLTGWSGLRSTHQPSDYLDAGSIPDFSKNINLKKLWLIGNKLTGRSGLISTYQSRPF